MVWKRRRFFDEFFGDIEEELREMEENMARIFEDARRMPIGKQGESMPYIYGFSMRVGPYGKPHIEEFGNTPGIGISGTTEISEEREPLIDVIEGEKEITVITEIPGIEKKDIQLNTTEDSLEIDIDTPERKYHKKLKLHSKIRTEDVKASYKNGVLEVKLKRLKEKKVEKGMRINID